jgi:hypothetical protein
LHARRHPPPDRASIAQTVWQSPRESARRSHALACRARSRATEYGVMTVIETRRVTSKRPLRKLGPTSLGSSLRQCYEKGRTAMGVIHRSGFVATSSVARSVHGDRNVRFVLSVRAGVIFVRSIALGGPRSTRPTPTRISSTPCNGAVRLLARVCARRCVSTSGSSQRSCYAAIPVQ